MINYLNDPLLDKEPNPLLFKNVNYFISKKEQVILYNNVLNLYTALVKYSDFNHLHSQIFCNINLSDIDKHLSKKSIKKNYRIFRRDIARYYDRKKIKVDVFNLWKKKGVFPFSLLRVISLKYKNDKYILSSLIKKIKYFTDVQNRVRFLPPKKIGELLSDKYAYFSGCCLGDGGFSNQTVWSMVDGSASEERISDSFTYLTAVRNLIKNMFYIEAYNASRRDNRVELLVNGKGFTRFLNFYFGLPYGKKKDNIEIPKIFLLHKNHKGLYSLFLRGLFDTDGYCSAKDKNISLSSGTKKLIIECKDYLKEFNIDSQIYFGKSMSYSLDIPARYYKKFAYNVGFSHPRKKRNMLIHLSRGCVESKPIVKQNLCGFLDVGSLSNMYVHGFPNILKDYRKNNSISAVEMGKVCGVKSKRLYALEKKSFIKMNHLVHFWKLSGNKYDNLLLSLHDRRVTFSYGRDCRNKIFLPIRLDKNYIYLFNQLRPYGKEVRILKKGVDNLKEFIQELEKALKVKVEEKCSGVYSIFNGALSYYLENFFKYEPYWKKLSKKEISKLDNRLSKIFV